jgi:hypothetical protein
MKALLGAVLNMCLGLLLGLLALELILHANPILLPRGMAAPAPVDPAVLEQVYQVYSSDADVFFWQPELVRPPLPQEDALEATVHYFTDEFGFPNRPPNPARVDLAVLGRSYSMGAQAARPWTRLLAEQGDLRLLNLSQTGSGITLKADYLRRFGAPRRPRWVIVEVLPSKDVLGAGAPGGSLFVSDLFYPILQNLARRWRLFSPLPAGPLAEPLYPLALDFDRGTAQVVFYQRDLSALTVEMQALRSSQEWQDFTAELLRLDEAVRRQGGCLVLLYAPTKEEIYLPLAQNPAQLAPALTGLPVWLPDGQGRLQQATATPPDLARMQVSPGTARALVAEFAAQAGLALIDPSQALSQAVLNGQAPYMKYDTHWSDLGHQIVAQQALQVLQTQACP